MRTLLYLGITLFSIVFMSSPQKNELANTSWKGMMNVPEPSDVHLKFTVDTFYVLIDATVIETTAYTVSNDTLTFQKVMGGSPCGDEMGTYTYLITNDVLSIHAISDVCDARSSAISPLGYTKEN